MVDTPEKRARGAGLARMWVLVALAGCLAVGVSVAIWCSARGGRATGPSTPGEAGQAADRPIYVELVELNQDTFRELQTFPYSPTTASEAPPFTFADGQVGLREDLAEETDAEKLDAAELRLGKADVPLRDCRLLVVHTIVYAGVGRGGILRSYYAFPDLSGAISLPPPPPSVAKGKFEHDPGADAAVFLTALNAIRLAGGGQVELTAMKDGELEIRYKESSWQLMRGSTKQIQQESRKLQVKEGQLRAGSVKFIGPPPADGNAVLKPAVDHGEITFTTTLFVSFEDEDGALAGDLQ